MAVKCPTCKNDLYNPFTYCDSCGWEAEGKDLDKAQKLKSKESKKSEKDLSKRRKEMTDKYLKREEKLGRRVPDHQDEDDYEELDDNEFKDIFGEFDDDDDEDEYSTGSPRQDSRREEEEEGVMIPCKCGNVIKVMSSKRPIRISCPKCGKGGTLKKDPPGAEKIKPKGKKRERPAPPDDDEDGNKCPECGKISRGTKFCPECGAKLSAPKKERPPERNRERPAEKKAGRDIPKKGKCSECGSTHLQFKEDGRGRCADCKHKFWWDKSKKPQKDGEGSERGGREEKKRDRGGRDKDKGSGGGSEKKKPPKCPECGDRMEFIKKYKRFYCWECNLYED